MLTACGDNAVAPKPVEPEQVTKVCEKLEPMLGAVCAVTPGDDTRLIKGTVLTPGVTFVGGQVAFDATGTITCVGCDCAAGSETTITCPQGVISPGLINTHDHITFAQNSPLPDTGERFEHRHDWRTGLRGHTVVDVPGSASNDAIRFGELRFLFGGATSTNGSGGQPGILRNLDRDALLEGLEQAPIQYQTFPLAETSSTQRRSTCNYGGSPDTDMFIADKEAYTPHIAEGIDQVARNEFLCTSSDSYDVTMPGLSNDVMVAQTAVIHGTGLLAPDFALMAQRNSALIWSPRTNVSLYGDTAQVTTASRLGVQIALGTDWIASGSTNLLRELRCADELNRNYYNGFFSDAALWRMATANAAAAIAMDDAIGVLTPGNIADIAIFDARDHAQFRAVIEAQPKDVALVLRGGKPLYGDETVISALRTPGSCDAVDVCGAAKSVCLMDEIGKTWAQLRTALPNAYPAFYCGVPDREPTCKPSRSIAVNSSTVYTGERTATDKDGDGIVNGSDNCPDVFNPVRPVDNGKQADTDGDGDGDPCDVCPLDAGVTACKAFDPEDRDADGRPNSADNCPMVTNAAQNDADGDGKGDACDDCPMAANMGIAPCPATIYAVKKGTIPVDSQVVITNALVTGKGSNGFFIQVKESDAGYDGPSNSGLFVFTTNAANLTAAEVGGRVTLEGQMTNFFGQLEVSNVLSVARVGASTEAAPAPTVATIAELGLGGSKAVTLESVIVRTATSTVSALNAGTGEFTATQAAKNLIVDDFLFVNPSFPGIDQSYATLTGILAFRNNAPRLEPRGAGDLDPIARLASVSTNTAFVRAGTTDAATIPAPLTVRLTMPVATDTFIPITSSDDTKVTVTGGGVTIAAGATSAPILLSGLAQATSVTLTATLASQSQVFTTAVRVLDAVELPTAVNLGPDNATTVPGGNVTFTVSLDVPAPLGGAVVALTMSPIDAGTIPVSVTIPENQISASFVYADGRTTGTASVTATAAFGTPDTSQIAIVATPTGLVINELDYDMVGTDNAEYVEIYNATSSPVSLTDLALVFVNGTTTPTVPVPTEYKRSLLAGANNGVLPAGGYLVIGVASLVVAPGAILYTPPGWAASDNIQNGAPDGVALINVTTGAILDRLSYEGPITACNITGITGTVNLVEGTALATAVADSNSAIGALARIPNGSDSNNANVDWKFSTTLTPGAANLP